MRTKALATIVLSASLAVTPSLFAGRVSNREVHQQDRIAQGFRSGALTARETAHLEKKERALQLRLRHMRKDGTLTFAEHRRLERQQERLSKDIYRQKHDGQAGPR